MTTDSPNERLHGESPSDPQKIGQLRFTESDLKAFSAASHDSNPLHLDRDYARRTPYGRPVVFGVLAVLRCLERIRQDSSRQVCQIEAEFSHPLFADVDYQLRVDELRADRVVVEVCEGELVLARVKAVFRAAAGRKVPGQPVGEVAEEWRPEGLSLRDVPNDHEDDDPRT